MNNLELKFINKVFLWLVLFNLAMGTLYSQITLSETKHDLGVVEEDSDRIIEMKAFNEGDEEARLIRISNPNNEFDYKFSSSVIPAKGSIDIRLQFNPKQKGRRMLNLTFYFDKVTIEYSVKGTVKWLSGAYTPCPDFDKSSEAKTNFETQFLVKDLRTDQVISNAKISLQNRSPINYELYTDKRGAAKEIIKLAFYDIKVSADGYKRMDSLTYVNRKLNNFIFYMEPIINVSDEIVFESEMDKNIDKEEISTIRLDDLNEEKVDEDIAEEIEELIMDGSIDIVEGDVTSNELGEVEEENITEYSSSEFKSNNIVFLLDVSTSMKKEDRLLILKKSMSSLSEMLRPQDVISIITYATETNVLLEGQSVSDTQEIIDVINSISGKGSTAGAKGIKKAYALATKYFIEGGNNHVYIASDGAFDKNDNRLVGNVKRMARKGVNLSVISLRSSTFAKGKLSELSQAGQGEILEIESLEEADESLKTLIKRQSRF